jgi:hypothetical protein
LPSTKTRAGILGESRREEGIQSGREGGGRRRERKGEGEEEGTGTGREGGMSMHAYILMESA